MDTSYRESNSHGVKGGNSSKSSQMMEEGPGEVVVFLYHAHTQNLAVQAPEQRDLTLKAALKSLSS